MRGWILRVLDIMGVEFWKGEEKVYWFGDFYNVRRIVLVSIVGNVVKVTRVFGCLENMMGFIKWVWNVGIFMVDDWSRRKVLEKGLCCVGLVDWSLGIKVLEVGVISLLSFLVSFWEVVCFIFVIYFVILNFFDFRGCFYLKMVLFYLKLLLLFSFI